MLRSELRVLTARPAVAPLPSLLNACARACRTRILSSGTNSNNSSGSSSSRARVGVRVAANGPRHARGNRAPAAELVPVEKAAPDEQAQAKEERAASGLAASTSSSGSSSSSSGGGGDGDGARVGVGGGHERARRVPTQPGSYIGPRRRPRSDGAHQGGNGEQPPPLAPHAHGRTQERRTPRAQGGSSARRPSSAPTTRSGSGSSSGGGIGGSAHLTVALLRCQSVDELLACIQQHQEHGNEIAMAAGITHLAKLVERADVPDGAHPGKQRGEASYLQDGAPRRLGGGPQQGAVLSSATEALRLATSLLQPHLPKLNSRGYANCVWACAKIAAHCGAAVDVPSAPAAAGARQAGEAAANQEPARALADLASACVASLAGEFVARGRAKHANAQDLANMCYALALLGLGDNAAWDSALLPRLLQIAPLFRPHALASVFWALGRLQKRPPPHVLHALVAQAMRLLAEHGWQSTEGHGDRQGACVASDLVRERAQLPQFLSNVTWALGRLQERDKSLLASVETAFLDVAGNANVQNIANMLWAFATLEEPGQRLFPELSDRVQGLARDGRLGAQSLSNILWAYAKAGFYDVSLFDSFCFACQAALPRFNSQDLANCAWALGQVSHRDKRLFAAVARAVPQSLPDMSPQEVSQVLWSMATLNFTSKVVCEAVSARVVTELRDPGTATTWRMQTLANVAWAYAVMMPDDAELFAAVFARVDTTLALDGTSGAGPSVWAGGDPEPDASDPGVSDIRHKRQLFQAHLAHRLAAAQCGAAAAALSPRTLPGCRAAWLSVVTRVKRSGTQGAVLDALRAMGYAASPERVIARGLFCVDVLVQIPGARRTSLVVEVDGPFHYAANDPAQPLGETLLRNRLIRALGYVLACVPGYEWHALDGTEQQHAYLVAKLEEAMSKAAAARPPPRSGSGQSSDGRGRGHSRHAPQKRRRQEILAVAGSEPSQSA